MKSDRDDDLKTRLYLLAGSVADDEEVDWPVAESATHGDQLATVRKLRLLSRLSLVNKERQETEYPSEEERASPRPIYEHETWGPLQIEERIGSGSFGEVLRARDPVLERSVALKLYYPDRKNKAQQTSELLAEGRLLARVQHPNVATVHGAESHAGRIGIWMEYIPGATLEHILQDQATLPAEEALLIARDVCRALAALHGAGVIHRDVKASNIMRTEDGRIVLVDLGVSRDVDDFDSERLYGTPLFAAPEILLTGTSTPQSDLYSVGVLLFLMACGEYPVPGSSLAEIREGHQTGRARLIRDLRPNLPDSFLTIIERALAPDPADRFARADEFEQALEQALSSDFESHGLPGEDRKYSKNRKPLLWALGIILPLAIVALAGTLNLLPRLPWKSGDVDGTPRILVTFFENRTGDESLDPVGPMAADWIIQGLSLLQIAHVVPVMTVLQSARNATTGEDELHGAELILARADAVAATMVVAGVYYLNADSLRFLANITDTQRGRVLQAPLQMSGPRDRPLEALERLRQKIMSAIAVYIDPRWSWTRDGEPYRYPTLPNYEAYREFVAGLEHFGLDYSLARQHFERATEIDSSCVEPLFWTAAVYSNLGQTAQVDKIMRRLDSKRDQLSQFARYVLNFFQAELVGDRSEAVRNMRLAAEITPRDFTINYILARSEFADNYPRRTVETLALITPNDSFYDTWFGIVRLWLLDKAYYSLGDYERELATVNRVIELRPNRMWSRCSKVRALAALGRVNEIDAVIDECLSIPHQQAAPAEVMSAAARELRVQGHYEQAREYANRAVSWCLEQPDPAGLRNDLAEALRLSEQWADARVIIAQLSAENPDQIEYLGKLGTLAARLGDEDQAREIQDGLAQLDRPYVRGEHLFWCACISAQLGERERSAAYLREAIRQGLGDRDYVQQEMDLEPLRDYRPFQDLIRPRG